MLGSLIVQARAISPSRRAATRSQYAANRSGMASLLQPPWSASHSGVVKWWKVTTGATPASSSPSHSRA